MRSFPSVHQSFYLKSFQHFQSIFFQCSSMHPRAFSWGSLILYQHSFVVHKPFLACFQFSICSKFINAGSAASMFAENGSMVSAIFPLILSQGNKNILLILHNDLSSISACLRLLWEPISQIRNARAVFTSHLGV